MQPTLIHLVPIFQLCLCYHFLNWLSVLKMSFSSYITGIAKRGVVLLHRLQQDTLSFAKVTCSWITEAARFSSKYY